MIQKLKMPKKATKGMTQLPQDVEARFDKLSTTFVGEGGWCCVTDNDDNYAIWPECYKEVKAFIAQELEARERQVREKEQGKLQRIVRILRLTAKERNNLYYSTAAQMVSELIDPTPITNPSENK